MRGGGGVEGVDVRGRWWEGANPEITVIVPKFLDRTMFSKTYAQEHRLFVYLPFDR